MPNEQFQALRREEPDYAMATLAGARTVNRNATPRQVTSARLQESILAQQTAAPKTTTQTPTRRRLVLLMIRMKARVMRMRPRK